MTVLNLEAILDAIQQKASPIRLQKMHRWFLCHVFQCNHYLNTFGMKLINANI